MIVGEGYKIEYNEEILREINKGNLDPQAKPNKV